MAVLAWQEALLPPGPSLTRGEEPETRLNQMSHSGRIWFHPVMEEVRGEGDHTIYSHQFPASR